MIKLIATDMDGTFLNAASTYDKERFSEVLNQLNKKGVVFAAASGRQLLSLQNVFSDFKDQMAFVAENGAIVTYEDEILFEEVMSMNDVKKILDLVSQNERFIGQKILLSGEKGFYIFENSDPDYIEKSKIYYSNLNIIKSLDEVDDKILKLSANLPADYILEFESWLNSRIGDYRAVTTGFEGLDIIPSHINKATGLEKLAEKLNINPNEIAAFGDNHNDLEMLEYAGHSYAVDNARERVKSVSENIIGHHNAGAVIDEIEKIIHL
ncbi:Cof-type HAD-IIB family hydrolase [Floricoccus penangensis]|uniref:Cof-type HAD-IIB family hydrolase n=1 Tax=Floricoccus penangensis TaxID=1859475 RepID=UPI00203B37D9|nr:Cof-type HAD-IIB family hydrolase [Floricoccus penangensis]